MRGRLEPAVDDSLAEGGPQRHLQPRRRDQLQPRFQAHGRPLQLYRGKRARNEQAGLRRARRQM